MSEEQQNLTTAFERQRQLVNEINQLNTEINIRKESALKLQGIIEYLQSKGAKLPEPEVIQTSEETSEKGTENQ